MGQAALLFRLPRLISGSQHVRQLHVTGTCRWLPSRIASGPTNMALDEALLEQVAERGDLSYLRAYGWSEATLSLGYFQRMAEVEVEPRWHFVPRVRRATGGGAIWHDHELTYALVLPSNHPRARPHTALYQAVHSAIAGILRQQGVEVQRRGSGSARDRERSSCRPFLCFTDSDPEDIVTRWLQSRRQRTTAAGRRHPSAWLDLATSARTRPRSFREFATWPRLKAIPASGPT